MAKRRKSLFKLNPRDKGRVALGVLGFVLVVALYFLWDLPDIDKVKPLDSKPSITILANDGSLIARYGGVQGDRLDIHNFPPNLVHAVVAIEDRRFYSHFGIDPLGMARAMLTNLRSGRWAQGGSTITQQLAKNLFLTPDKTIRRKVQEALMALEIEHRFTKDQIITAYLNRVYFGAGAYGVDAAARTYFDKPASQLTLWECATLAGVLKAPSRFSPSANPEQSRQRAAVVIAAMKEAGYLSKRNADTTIARAKAAPPAATTTGDYNRYFADWVIDQVGGFIGTADSDIVVKTTLDPRLQRLAEQKKKDLFARIPPTDKVAQVALVTERPDGAVLAMEGGLDYRTSQFNRATQAWRQPGSSFKPFVYIAALENGMTPDTKVDDKPITEGDYRPGNYDDKYFGEVTLTEALAHSLNSAAIRVLQQVGVQKMLDVASRMGLTGTLRPELATGLGAGEATLLEMTSAYAVIQNGGTSVWPYAILSITDGEGQVLYQRSEIDRPRVFEKSVMEDIDSMMQHTVMPGGTGEAARLSRGHVAGKTGTTQNYRDAWFIGYTDKFITGVWVGNDDGASMKRVTGGRYPAMLWRDYMEAALDIDAPEFKLAPASGDDSGFGGMLDRWSTDNSSRAAPVYEYNQ